MRNTTIFASLVMIISVSSSAAPCKVAGDESKSRWITPLGMNELYKTHPAGDVATWPFTKQRYYYQQAYKDTPDEACKLWAAKVQPNTVFTKANRDLWSADRINDNLYECNFDCNRNLRRDPGDVSACSAVNPRLVYALVRDTDPVCDRMSDVNGPYASQASGSYARGADFTTPQKNAIKAANKARDAQSRLTSDAYNVPSELGPGLWLLHSDVQYLDATAGSTDSVQIDHTVPRKDVYGCGCGTNSPANALAISAGLNNGMSNDPASFKRVALLARYAPIPGFAAAANLPGPPQVVPSVVDDVAGDDGSDDSDEGSDAEQEIGGCSAGGAGGGATLALVGLAALVQRRRRR